MEGPVPGEDTELLDHLACVASPPGNGTATDGAALSLALHVCMVSRGFVTTGPGSVQAKPLAPLSATWGRRRAAALRPPSEWQAEGPNEWNAEYVYEGKAAVFKLTVALHRNSNRVFVHASEAGNLNNIQVLGLTLDTYVPDASALRTAKQWGDVLRHSKQLVLYMDEHVVQPLLRNATSGDAAGLPTSGAGGGIIAASGLDWLLPPDPAARQQALLLGAGFVAVLSAAMLASWWFAPRRSPPVAAP